MTGAEPPGWSFLVRDSSGIERVVPLREGTSRDAPLTVGRDPSCAIRLDSPYVSRFHARIEQHDGRVTLVDLGSRNGSLVNGARVDRAAALSDGDIIAIGDFTVLCRFATATGEPTRTLVFHGTTPVAPAAPVGPEATPAPDTPSTDDALRVDPNTYDVTLGGQPLPRRLSAQEFQLLSYLYEHRQRVCTRQELGDTIWGRDKWDTNMLHRLVHRLKEKLEPAPDRPRYVQTIPWVGYRLTP